MGFMNFKRFKNSALIFFSVSAAVHAGLFYVYYDAWSEMFKSANPDRRITISFQPVSLPEMVVESVPEPKPDIVPEKEKHFDETVLLASNSLNELALSRPEPLLKPEPEMLVKPKPIEKVESKKAQSVVKKPVVEPDKAKTVERVAEKSAATPEPFVAANSDLAATDHEQVKADYLEYLYQRIRENKFYPSKAKRWQAEGRVVVSFSITRDGHINELLVTETSGNRHLDKAALTTIRKVEPLKALPMTIAGNDWQLKIPLDYKLIN